MTTTQPSVFPSLERRGGCASKKKSRSHRSSADGVVAHKPRFGINCCKMACERPPRPLHQRRLRDILLMSRPPLLCKEGNGAHHRCGVRFIHTFVDRPYSKFVARDDAAEHDSLKCQLTPIFFSEM